MIQVDVDSPLNTVSEVNEQRFSVITCGPHTGSGVIRERSTLHVVGPSWLDVVEVDVLLILRKLVADGIEVAVGEPPEMASPARGISLLVYFQ